jgi:hypothetical protein
MKLKRLLLPLLFMLAMTGCGKPVPADKAAFVGEWQAKNMYLLITQDGTIQYKRQEGNTSTSINGPLKGFVGNNFETGVGPLTTTFVVTRAPFQEEGKWKMVVDGVELSKTVE